MGEAVVLYFLVLFFVFILGHGVNWLDLETSNDDFASHNSIHEFERLLMCEP